MDGCSWSFELLHNTSAVEYEEHGNQIAAQFECVHDALLSVLLISNDREFAHVDDGYFLSACRPQF